MTCNIILAIKRQITRIWISALFMDIQVRGGYSNAERCRIPVATCIIWPDSFDHSVDKHLHAFQCNCYLNPYHVVLIDPSRTVVNKRGKICSLYFETIIYHYFYGVFLQLLHWITSPHRESPSQIIMYFVNISPKQLSYSWCVILCTCGTFRQLGKLFPFPYFFWVSQWFS